MKITIKQGMSAKQEITVAYKDTAKAVSSGLAEVFATPSMIALMEKAAYTAVQSELPDGYATVGISINARHMAPTPVGVKVWAEAVLKEVEGRRLIFHVTAYDAYEMIGEAEHVRFVIDEEKFMQKAVAKGAS